MKIKKSYYLKTDKKDEIKNGRTISFFAQLFCLNANNLSMIFNGRNCCSRVLAMAIINVSFNIPIYSNEMEEKIKYFFYVE